MERAVVRMTLMRTTLHLVTARDAVRLRPVMQDVCARAFASSPFRRDLEGLDLEAVRQAGFEILSTETLSTAALGKRLAERWPDRPPTSLAYAVRYLLPVVQVPPRGLLSSTAAPKVAPLATWLDVDAGALTQPAPPDEVVLRYLRAFGPATTADIRTWSWLSAAEAGDRPPPAATARLPGRSRPAAVRRRRRHLRVTRGSRAGPLPRRVRQRVPVARRSHADHRRPRPGVPAGWAGEPSSSNGFLAGAWWIERAKDAATLRIEPLEPFSASDQDDVAGGGNRALAAPRARRAGRGRGQSFPFRPALTSRTRSRTTRRTSSRGIGSRLREADRALAVQVRRDVVTELACGRRGSTGRGCSGPCRRRTRRRSGCAGAAPACRTRCSRSRSAPTPTLPRAAPRTRHADPVEGRRGTPRRSACFGIRKPYSPRRNGATAIGRSGDTFMS